MSGRDAAAAFAVVVSRANDSGGVRSMTVFAIRIVVGDVLLASGELHILFLIV